MFHPHWRQQALASLAEPFDLLIVGGGITGCGILLDASQRGLRCLLIEKGDIASGTSSRSSKLIHGGLRYLKQMQFRVTRHSCTERDRMLDLSPHLVDPLRFVYPAYRGDKTPGWQVDLGLWLYDRLTSRPDKHTHLDAEEVHALVPGLPTEGLDRALAYGDARADDARLTLAVAATGFAYGGQVLTHAAPEEGIRNAKGSLAGLVVRDLESGATHRVAASLVVNATGAWCDRLREQLGHDGKRVRPSRGTHLIFAASTLPLAAAVTFPSPDDGRPVFFIPHDEGILVGTTDIFHDGPLDDPRPTPGEVDYLLRATASAFPGRAQREDVVGAFAGLRPVLDSHGDNPSKASREEDFWDEDGLLSIAGGKLTTWRSTAEDVVDAALELLPEERARRVADCATEGTPMVGLAPRDLGKRLVDVHGIDLAVARGMARRLAAVAWTACELADGPQELRPLADGVDLCAAEVRAHARYGAVVHLSDLLLRRARLGMWTPAVARALAPRVAEIVAREFGWDAPRLDAELERYGVDAEGWTLRGARADVAG